MQASEIFQVLSIAAAAIGVCFAALTFIRTQKWLQLRFASEVIEKIYSDDTLRLAVRFLDWHDRELVLPEAFATYGDPQRRFLHKVANMAAAMSTANREFNEETGVYDLKAEYRKPEYVIYVEVFDQFFDYLSQLDGFIKAGLIKDKQITPLAYVLRRLDALKVFQEYMKKYEIDDVLELIARVRKPSYAWVKGNQT